MNTHQRERLAFGLFFPQRQRRAIHPRGIHGNAGGRRFRCRIPEKRDRDLARILGKERLERLAHHRLALEHRASQVIDHP
jgi:hypothetical protein